MTIGAPSGDGARHGGPAQELAGGCGHRVCWSSQGQSCCGAIRRATCGRWQSRLPGRWLQDCRFEYGSLRSHPPRRPAQQARMVAVALAEQVGHAYSAARASGSAR